MCCPMTIGPRTIDALADVEDLAERARAAGAYIAERQQAITRARQLRDDALRELIDKHGVTAAARMCEVSVSHAKQQRK